MIKMNVSAETFDGDMVTETLWFHMNKVDLIELQQSEPGRFTEGTSVISKGALASSTISNKPPWLAFSSWC